MLAENVIPQQAEYMLAVKGHQDPLAQDIAALLAGVESAQWQAVRHAYHQSVNNDHARLEVRQSRSDCAGAMMLQGQQ
jgi:hypothetical protein